MQKKKQGISLIVLVITIIVMIVLAAAIIISLQNNGIINKASAAKRKYNDKEYETQIKISLLQYEVEKSKDNSLTLESWMYTNLENLFGDGNITITHKSEAQEFPMTIAINNSKFDIERDGTIEKTPDYETLRSAYGKVVNGYTGYEATDVTEWKLYYVDEENKEAFIISSDVIDMKELSAKSNSNVNYTGSNDLLNFEYAIKYNGLWLEQCEEENTNNTAKYTAYMCDPSNWSQYCTGKAKYAAGGATYEMYIASIYNKQVIDFKDPDYNSDGYQIKNVSSDGYPHNNGSLITNNDLYKLAYSYWLASPNSHIWQMLIYHEGYAWRLCKWRKCLV